MGNHELYMRRRKPESLEIQQMKKEAQDERNHRLAEMERLKNEMKKREDAEQKQREYEEAWVFFFCTI